jgi:hypothetical protein
MSKTKAPMPTLNDGRFGHHEPTNRRTPILVPGTSCTTYSHLHNPGPGGILGIYPLGRQLASSTSGLSPILMLLPLPLPLLHHARHAQRSLSKKKKKGNVRWLLDWLGNIK